MIDFGTDVVLVTGANGWLGRNLVQTLLDGDPDCPLLREPQPQLTVRAMIVPGDDASFLQGLSPRVEVVETDLRNREDCRRFVAGCQRAILFHTAGVIHPGRTARFFEVNVEGTANLLQAATESQVARAVVVSSNSPCGTNPHPDHIFDEDSPYRPYMSYGRSKVQMERLVRQFQQSGQIETVIIRPPWFYGPHQPPRQSLFFRMIRAGRVPVVGTGENLRSMAYVGNICQALVRAALSKEANGQTYWIADEKPYSMNQIIDTIRELLKVEFGLSCAERPMKLPYFVGQIATVADACIQKAGLYWQKMHVLSEMNKTIACSIEKARRELGYEPAVALKEGMRRSIQWCLESGIPI